MKEKLQRPSTVRKVILEPVGRFAFLVAGAHVLLGVVLLWWFKRTKDEPAESPGQDVTWMAPADFKQDVATPPVPATPPAPSSPAESKPAPAPEVAAAPAKTEAKPVPKAIAVDPAQAAAIMARAREAEQAKAKPAAPEPQLPPPSPPPSPKPEPKVATAPAKPADVDPEPPPLKRPAPPRETPAPKPPDAKPERPVDNSNVSRTVMVSRKEANGTGANGAAKGVRFEEVDKAIMNAFLQEWIAPDASKIRPENRTAKLYVEVLRNGTLAKFHISQPSGCSDLDDSAVEAADRLGKIAVKFPSSFKDDRYAFEVHFHVE